MIFDLELRIESATKDIFRNNMWQKVKQSLYHSEMAQKLLGFEISKDYI